MNPITRFMKKLSILFGRERFVSELDEEMAFHRAQVEKEFVANGMTAEDARYAAMRQFGNATKLTEQSQEAVAFRVEMRGRSRLKPLPYATPSQLMSVNESNVESPRWPLSYPDYLDWQRQNKSFSSVDVYSGAGYLLRTPSGAEPVQAERVSGSFFQTLGVHAMLGRDFYPGENRPGGPNVVILSYGAWLHRFGARRDLLGQTVDLDNEAYTVIGVLPGAFSFAPGRNAEFWVPLNGFSPHEKMRTFYNFWGIGRLRDGVTVQAAEAEMATIAKQLQRQYAITGHDQSASVVPLSEIITGDVRPILLTLLGGAGLLLLIACITVASLVLVRWESRRREIAVRGALGASPLRLMRQFVTEGLLLTLFGNVA